MIEGDEKMKRFELIPIDGRKSFYGKALVTEENNGLQLLTSYNTPICTYDEKTRVFRKIWLGYSATTMRHINSFRVSNGLPQIGKKEWLAMEI